MKKLTAFVGMILILSACADERMTPTATFSRPMQPKLSFDVQTISLTDRTTLQPVNSPYNSNKFSPTISDAIKQWAGDRLQAVGQSGNAIVVIKDATLVAQPIPTQSGIDSWFTRQQSVKYVGRAEVSIEATGRNGFAMADGVASRSITLPEDPTPAERQDAYINLLNGLMKDLGQNLDAAIQSHMGSFIVSPPVLGMTAVPEMQAAQPAVMQPVAAPMPQPSVMPKAPVFGSFGATQSNLRLANQDQDENVAPQAAAQTLEQQMAAHPQAEQRAESLPQSIFAPMNTQTAMATQVLPVPSNGAIIIPLSGPATR